MSKKDIAYFLGKKYAHFYAKSNGLLDRLYSPLPVKPREQESCGIFHVLGRSFLVVRLQHIWGEYCRELVIHSALGSCRTVTGTLLAPAPGIANYTDIERLAKKLKKPLTGTRASWHDPRFTLDIADCLRITNYNTVSLGLASVSTADLVAMRNFLVHPNIRTRQIYGDSVSPATVTAKAPDTQVLSPIVGGGTVFEGWVKTLQQAARNAID